MTGPGATTDGKAALAALRAGGKRALARSLGEIERQGRNADVVALLDAAFAAPKGHVIGLTGPPGAGKSTLMAGLVGRFRDAGLTVGVIAVDPSSARSGGAFLGDRVRLGGDGTDPGFFMRSLAAREQTGGLAALCLPAMVLMRALFDIVLIETVGVGQSATDIADLADTVVLTVQPASGDAIQFLKAGIMEIPDLAVVTKADLGAPARATLRQLQATLIAHPGSGGPEAMLVSAGSNEGMEELAGVLMARRDAPDREARRRLQPRAWLRSILREEVGRRGLEQARGQLADRAVNATPFAVLARIEGALGGFPESSYDTL